MRLTFTPSEMYGFVEVEQILFGEKSQLLVDPGEEKLKTEFAGGKADLRAYEFHRSD